MDITNSIGGLGVLGVRALHLSGRETLLHIKNSNLIISALGSSLETPLFSKRRDPFLSLTITNRFTHILLNHFLDN